jgi:Glycosyl hydrolases family 25/Putative peptidoglycan binding domain
MDVVALRTPLREGDTGPIVAALQAWLNATFPLYSHIDLGPQRYGPQTVAVIAEFQRRAGVSGETDGRVIGPDTWAALELHGYMSPATQGAWTPVVDISEWQGAVDFAMMRSRGVAGLILRATHGTTVDKRLADYVHGARAAAYQDADLGFYSFINPKRGTAKDCAAATMAAINDVLGRPPVLYMLDIEDYKGQTPNKGQAPVFGKAFASWLREHINVVRDLAPETNIIAYSNASYWDGSVAGALKGTKWVGDVQLANELDWIVPRYHVYPNAKTQSDKDLLKAWRQKNAPPVPSKWGDWALNVRKNVNGPTTPSGVQWSGWQFSAGFNGQGSVYGASSTDLDLNIVNTEAWKRWTRAPT